MYATLDDSGFPTGFFHPEVHGDRIPSSVVPISEEDYTAFVTEPGQWTYVDGRRVPAPEPAVQARAVTEVAMVQARLQLLSMGLLLKVDAAIGGMPGAEGDAVRVEWEYAPTVRRDNAAANAIIALLGFSEEQVDAFFTGAAAR